MKLLAFRDKQTAVMNYRLTRPLLPLGCTFRKTLLRKNDNMQIGKLAERLKKIGDIWVMKYVDDFYTLNVIYTMRNAVKSKVIVDIDDNLFTMTPDNPSFGSPKAHANRCMMVLESIRCADWVTVSTNNLKEALKEYNERIVVLPNLIDPSEWKWERKKHKRVRIGWVYSPTHLGDIKEVRSGIKKLWKKYGDKIEIVVFGTMIDIFEEVPTTKIAGVPYYEYPRVLTEEGIDISIAPLKDTDFNRAKSNIKWLESTLAGAAFVGSRIEPYKEVKHGKTGLLVKKDWFTPIDRLVSDKILRTTLQHNALKEVLKYDYKLDKNYKTFYECI